MNRPETIRRVTFPATKQNGGEHRAREAMPLSLDEAIRFFDPFQARPNKEPK